jgi:transcriptional regulator with XRE-family HTH domain
MAATTQRSEIDVLIGQRVHHVLWRRKLQQRELASALGITQSTLSRRLRGESAWFAGDLVAVADALGVSVGWLFGEDETVRPKGFEPLTFWSVLWASVKRVAIRVTLSADDFGLAA